MNKLNEEIKSFQSIWKGGYLSGYNDKRGQKRIEEYLASELKTTDCLLEIGCGRGRWSKFIYPYVKELYCIDVLSETHNQFWEYVGFEKAVENKLYYYQVIDFSLSDIDDNSLDYIFSYDTFCHISYSGQKEYLKNLKLKCKKDAKLFIMYADPEKYLTSEPENIEHVKTYLPNLKSDISIDELIEEALADCNGQPFPGRWYWIGMEKFTRLCRINEYKILEIDLNIDKTNPITLIQNV